MKITNDLIKKIADNARIKLTDKEMKEFGKEMLEILKDFSILDKVNTDKIDPLIQPVPKSNVYREDKVGKCLTHKEIFANTKNKQEGYFKGPKVL